jgi:tRNA(Ile)-lysidine synthase
MEYNPALPQALAQMAALAQDEELYWAGKVGELAAQFLTIDGEAVQLDCTALLALPRAAGRRLLRRAIELVKGDLRRIDFEHIEALLLLAGGGEGHGRLQLPDLDVFRSFDLLRIGRPRRGSRADRDYRVEVAVPANVRIPGGSSTICLDLLEYPSCRPVDTTETGYTGEGSLLDFKSITEPLEVRNWRPGDRYTGVGRSSEKVKSLFQQERIPIWERQGWPVLTSGDRIVWLRKFGASAEVSPSAETSKVVRVTEIANVGPGNDT